MKTLIGVATAYLSEDEKSLLQHGMVAGVVLLARNCPSLSAMASLIDEIKALKPSVMICLDHEGGQVQRIHDPRLNLPSSFSWDCASSELRAQRAALQEAWRKPMKLLKDSGVDMLLGP